MRILFWSSTFWPSIGGVQILAGKLLPALEERGYQHLVVTTKAGCEKPETARFNEIPVHYLPFWSSMADIDDLVRMRRQISEIKSTFAPDLIHINGVSRCDFFHHLTALVHPAPLLVSLHNGWSAEEDKLVARTLGNATWVVACSQATLDEGRNLVPEIRTRSSVIHNGLDAPTYQPRPISFDPPKLLCLGRLVDDKGFDLALTAVASLINRFPQLSLTIAGDGPARAELEQLAATLGIVDSVRFTGWVDPESVAELVDNASAVIVPSRWQEPFCLVALEAALMERPVIATRVGGLPEVIVHEQTGLLVEPENSKELAGAIAYILEHSVIAEQMGQAGKERAHGHFGWNRYVDAYDGLYQRLRSQS